MRKYSRSTVLKCLLSNKDRANSPADSHALSSLYRWRGTIEQLWKQFVDKPHKLDRVTKAILSLGAYELHFSRINAAYATVSECVSLAKKESRHQSGLVNAVLKKVAALKDPVRPSIAEDFPIWIRETLSDKVLESLLEEPTFVIGPHSKPEPVASLAEHLKEEKEILVQSFSSRFVVDLLLKRLKQKEQASFLDLCTGKGTKLLSLLECFQSQRGRWVATDKSSHQLALAQDVLAKRNDTSTILIPFEEVDKEKNFDVILVDAPCSGSGTWSKNPRGKWVVTQDSVEEFQSVQKELIEKARALLAPDGVIVYGVCSLFEEERGSWDSPLESLPIPTEFLNTYGGHWEEVDQGCLVLPGKGFEGFFVKMVRQGLPV